MKVDRSKLPSWKYCAYCGHKVRSCEHIDERNSKVFWEISKIVDELGIPKTEKQIEKMAKRISKVLN